MQTKRKIEIYWLHEQDPDDFRIVLATKAKFEKGYMRCYGVVIPRTFDGDYLIHQSNWSYYPLKAKEDIGFTYIGKL